MQSHSRILRPAIARLEIIFALSILALLSQVYAPLGYGLLWALDLRNWSREVWFALNALVVLALLGVRFIPGLVADLLARRQRMALESAEAAKRQKLRDEREALQRIARSRKNRV